MVFSEAMPPYSIYLHVPFCRHRCAYCDFNTYAGQEAQISAYIQALRQEIEQVSLAAPERLLIHTIFFGGGTPSLVPAHELAQVMATLRACFDWLPGLEASLEANPGTVSPQYLQALRKAGINRLSFGVQSAHPDDLRLLERQHDFRDVVQAVKWARQTGFDNISLDLIFGVPFQSLERWQNTLELALLLKPEHLSLYALTVEHGTPFARWARRGLVPLPDDDLAADMYEWAAQRLADAGYYHYEISNWAKKAAAGDALVCRHNLQYWRGLPYLGFGAGAHGYAAGVRTANVLAIPAYIQRCKDATPRAFPLGPALANALPLDARTEMQEVMMVGLRLIEEGVGAEDFQARFGNRLEDVFGKEIRQLTAQGLLEWTVSADSRRLRLTRRGRLLGNRVFMQFVNG